MEEKLTPKAYQKALSNYISGFLLSVALSMGAYILTTAYANSNKAILSQPILLALILIFAVAQLLVQLYYFLHLAEEKRPRWRLLMAIFAVVVVFIVVGGSMWIMSNLNYRMMHMPSMQSKYLHSQGDL